jgi:transposase-like protein
MGRRPKVQRSAEEKFAIVMEGLKSGKVSETCRKHEIGPALFYRWKDELAKDFWAALGGGPQPHPPTKSRANASSNWSVPWGGRIYRSKS